MAVSWIGRILEKCITEHSKTKFGNPLSSGFGIFPWATKERALKHLTGSEHF